MSVRLASAAGRYILHGAKNFTVFPGEPKVYYHTHALTSTISSCQDVSAYPPENTPVYHMCCRHMSALPRSSLSPPRGQHISTTSTSNVHNSAYILCNHNLCLHGTQANGSTNVVTLTAAEFKDGLGTCGKCNPLGASVHKFGAQFGSFQRNQLQGYHPLGSYSPLDANWLVIRTLKTSAAAFKEESKVEQTVKALREEVKQKTEKCQQADVNRITLTRPTASDAPSPITEEMASTAVVPPKKSIGQRIIAELKHYYNGFKLLFIDVKVAIRLVWMLLNGKTLDRRERRQLVRTTADLFRLVPFLVFVIIPFMEFLLPVALKLFPGMLPSTFKEENKEQEKLRKKLKVKLEMAKFLQDTIEETALQRKGAKGETVQDFVDFMDKIRTSGEGTSNEAIMKYSKLFEDEITLDNLEYSQLRALCNLLELPTVGTSYFMRFQLRMKMRQLEADDRMIRNEGVDSLAIWELQEACRKRGMRSLGVPEARLKFQLSQWLDLHLNEQIPTSLLLLSRTLYLPEHLSTEDQLAATIVQLPDTTAEEAKVKISEVTADRVDNKTKLEIIKQEEEAIKQAKEEEARAEAEEQLAAKLKEQEALAEVGAQPITPTLLDSAPVDKEVKAAEVLLDKAPVLETKTEEVMKEQQMQMGEVTEEEEISSKELEEVEEVLERVAQERKEMSIEQEELEHLKEDVEEYKENLADLKEVMVASGGREEDIQESKAAQRLKKKVNKMIGQMDSFMSNLSREKEALLEDIEVKEVRIKRSTQLKENQELRQEVLDQITEQKEDLVSINELLESMRRLQKVSDDTKFQRIVQVLDEDRDGRIDINDALKVIELLGSENVKVSSTKMAEIVDLLKKEDQLEEAEKEEKKKEKMQKMGEPEMSDLAQEISAKEKQ